jgi:hypothetical protein
MNLSRTRLGAGVTALILPLALLAGCGEDEPTPKFEKPSSSPTASPSPDEPVKPTPPAAMEGDDVEAAKAFVEYYFEIWDYAVTSGDVRALEKLALPSCSTCATVTDMLRKAAKNDAIITGGEHVVRRAGFNPPSQQSGTSIFQGNAKVSNTRQTIEGSGVEGLDGSYPSGTVTYGMVLILNKGEWYMSEWRLM